MALSAETPFTAIYKLTVPGQFQAIHDLTRVKEDPVVTILKIDHDRLTLRLHHPDKFNVPGLQLIEKVAD